MFDKVPVRSILICFACILYFQAAYLFDSFWVALIYSSMPILIRLWDSVYIILRWSLSEAKLPFGCCPSISNLYDKFSSFQILSFNIIPNYPFWTDTLCFATYVSSPVEHILSLLKHLFSSSTFFYSILFFSSILDLFRFHIIFTLS